MAIDFLPAGWAVEPKPKVKTYLGSNKWNDQKMPAEENGGGVNMSKGESAGKKSTSNPKIK